MSMAWETTQDDVLAVLRRRPGMKITPDLVTRAFDKIADHDYEITKAALCGDAMEEQIEYAFDEIEKILIAQKIMPPASLLDWKPHGPESHSQKARIGPVGDGVVFYYERFNTCYRRGVHRLLIVVENGPSHHKWGCFDDADQPMRYYHDLENLRTEAELIAAVLLADRGPIGDS